MQLYVPLRFYIQKNDVRMYRIYTLSTAADAGTHRWGRLIKNEGHSAVHVTWRLYSSTQVRVLIPFENISIGCGVWINRAAVEGDTVHVEQRGGSK